MLCCLGSARLVLHSLVYSLTLATLACFFFLLLLAFMIKPVSDFLVVFGPLFVMRAMRLLVRPAAQ